MKYFLRLAPGGSHIYWLAALALLALLLAGRGPGADHYGLGTHQRAHWHERDHHGLGLQRHGQPERGVFGATQAAVTAAGATSLTVTVPLGATYQYPTVTNLTTPPSPSWPRSTAT